MTYTFSFPTLIHFGAGVRHQVAAAIKEKGLQAPLVVTDRGVVKQEFFTEFVNELNGSGLKTGV